MRNSPSRLEPDYSRRLLDLEIDAPSPQAAVLRPHPVTVRLERVDPEHAGTDRNRQGPLRRRLRRRAQQRAPLLGRALHGDSANHAWGVMDVLAVTDFPDIRMKSLIQSDNAREHHHHPAGRRLSGSASTSSSTSSMKTNASRTGTSPLDRLIEATQRILHPYKFEVKESPMVVGLRNRPAALR